jgi:predicted DNA-binding antitoxin AbrB/MazE fold protein
MELITAVYERGILRPLTPLSLAEEQTVRLQIVTDPGVAQVIQGLIAADLITPPPGTTDQSPVTTKERQEMANRIGRAVKQPLSQIILSERDET